MSESVTVGNRDIKFERTSVKPFIRANHQYARVEKVVPVDWLGEAVVIMREEDFNWLLNYIKSLYITIDELIEKTALKRTYIMEVQARQEAKEAANIKLTRSGLKFSKP